MKFKNTDRAAINGAIDEVKRSGKFPYLISTAMHTTVEARDAAPPMTMDSGRTAPPYVPRDAERAAILKMCPNFYRLK